MEFKEFANQMENLRKSINDLSPEEAAKFVIDAASNEGYKMTYRKVMEVNSFIEKTCGTKKEEFGTVFGRVDPEGWFNTFIYYHNKFTKFSESVKGNPEPKLRWACLGNQVITYLDARAHVEKLMARFIRREADRINNFRQSAPLLSAEIQSRIENPTPNNKD